MEQQIVTGILSKLKGNLISGQRDLEGLMYRKANYTKPKTYEYLSEYAPVTRAEQFTQCNTVFVKAVVQFPEEIRCDEDYEDCLFLRFHNLGGVVFVDGEPYNGIDGNRDRIPLRKEWAGQTKEILVEGYCLNVSYDLNNSTPTCLAYAYFGRVDKKVEKYIYDIQLANDWYNYDLQHPQEENIIIRKKITAAFEASIRYFDTSLTGEAFREAAVRADEILMEEIGKIDAGDVRSHMSLVASTHIDTAWLWQLKDTIRKCGHSYSNMLRLLDSFPEFKFSHSQVKLLDYTKEYYPDLYEQIKEMAKAGRWENVGAMWVESDCNVVSGESLVRQNLYGARFLEEEFGSRPRMAWLPDTFGFQPNLPQIFKKSGTDYFYSYKLHWQTQEEFPYGDFRWKGIDGSEILGSVINNTYGGYNGTPNPAQLRHTKELYDQKGEVDEIIFPYGYGDGGGGPTREMIEYAKRVSDFPGLPKCEISTAQQFFDRLEQVKEDLPMWYGELYIQTHRGTLTTEARTKRDNRHFEMLFQSLEKLGVMAQQCGADPNWELLREGWKKALVLQFHDILPGSSIDPVYEDCREIYAEVFTMADQFVESLGMCTKVQPKDGVRVINTLSWERDVLAKVTVPAADLYEGKTPETCSVEITLKDAAGIDATDIDAKKVMTVPCTVEIQGDMAVISFLAKGVKALSYEDYNILVKDAEKKLEKDAENGVSITRSAEGITVDNARYHAVIDQRGWITQLVDKRAGKKVLSAAGNAVRFFLDGPSWEDAWNIYDNYKKREVEVFEETSAEVTENNELRTVIRVHNTGKHIDFVQDIIFYQEKDRIDFVTTVDWQEKNKVMRVYFPTTMNAPYFTSETGFGAYSRPTVGSSKLEKAKFEVCAHRFADISENGYGVALLNDSKYGHDVQYNTLGLTLLRSTFFPANYPDLGMQQFTYSLLPHEGSWSQADVARAGIELNAEIHTISTFGKAPVMAGLLACDCKNLNIDTVKEAETGDGVVVRLYEANGTSGEAVLSFGKPVRKAAACDLLEKKIEDMEVKENTVSFSYTPYEIKTFLVQF